MRKFLLTLTTVTVVSLTGAFFGDAAQANSVSDLEDEQTNVEQKREDIKKDLSKAEAEVADVLINLEELKSEIKELEEAQEENNLVLADTEGSIKEHETEITKLEEDLETLEASIEKRNEILKERISSYQQNGGNISFIDVLFGSDNFGDFISRVSAVTKITNSDKQLMEDLEADQEKVVVVQEEVEEKLTEQEVFKEDLEEVEFILAEQKETNKDNEKELKKQEKKLTKTVAKLETEDSDLSALEATVSHQLNEARNPEPVVASNETTSSANNGSSSSSDSSTDSTDSTNSSSSSSSSNNGNTGNTTTLSEEKPKDTPKAPPANGGSNSAIQAAQGQLGISNQYVYGGKNPSTGFDCSGFVSWAYGQTGQSIPSNTASLRSVGTKVPYSQAQPGDLIFFDTVKADGHVAIYLGNGKFIGSQSSTGVGVQSVNDPYYWGEKFKGHVRRVN